MTTIRLHALLLKMLCSNAPVSTYSTLRVQFVVKRFFVVCIAFRELQIVQIPNAVIDVKVYAYLIHMSSFYIVTSTYNKRLEIDLHIKISFEHAQHKRRSLAFAQPVRKRAVGTLWQRCGNAVSTLWGLLERYGRVVGAPRASCKDAV